MLCAVISSAHAQSIEAEALFDQGNRLMADGQIEQACAAFEAANRAEPGAGTLIHLGECRERNQQLASAWAAYEEARIRARDPRKRQVATENASALASKLSHLTISIPDDSRVEGLTITCNGKSHDTMLWNQASPVDGGDHAIVARAPGYEDWQTTAHVTVQGDDVTVVVPRLAPLHDVTPPPVTRSTTPSRSATPERPHETTAAQPRRFTTSRKVALGVAGAAGAATAVGAVLGTIAKRNQSEAFQLCSDPDNACPLAGRSNALIQSGRNRAFQANVAFGVTGAAGIAAIVLWVAGRPVVELASQVSAVPHLAPGEASLSVAGRF